MTFLPITEWTSKPKDFFYSPVGPMAQDFHAAFGLGEDDRHISTTAADGVAAITPAPCNLSTPLLIVPSDDNDN